jgi:hypothetical protein
MIMYDIADPFGEGGDGGTGGTGTTGTSGTGSPHPKIGGNGWWDAVAGVWRTFTDPLYKMP